MSIAPVDQPTAEIDHYLFLLRDLVWKILEDAEELPALKKRFGLLLSQGYPEGLQLPRAYLVLIAHLLKLDPLPIQPEQFPNGTALLDTLGWCGSRELPEPIELAQLGVLWMILGVRLKNEMLQRAGIKIAVWQVHLLDAEGHPHLSLWSRSDLFRPSMLSLWNHALFTIAYRLTGQSGFAKLAELAREEAWDPKAFPVRLLVLVPSMLPPSLQPHLRPFAEEMTVGMIKFSTPEISLMAHLSGWNSGLFSFHKKEVALVNAGPQAGSYDALERFGICRTWGMKERPFQEIMWEKSAYHCHLKGWTKIFALPLWLELSARLQAGQTTFDIHFQEKGDGDPNNLKDRFLTTSALPQNFRPHSRLASRQWSLAPDKNSEEPPGQIPDSSSCLDLEMLSMVLFLRCPKLGLGGKYQLESGTLETYKGKSLPLELQGPQEKMILHPDPALTMQVIPLAGGDHFWGADFLVALPIFPGQRSFSLTIK